MSLLQDTIGLPDLTLLDEVDEEKIMGNLKDRFMNGKIYTSVGEVIVSINPYKKFDIYGDDFVAEYKGKNLYELPPHM
jgi:myosin-1